MKNMKLGAKLMAACLVVAVIGGGIGILGMVERKLIDRSYARLSGVYLAATIDLNRLLEFHRSHNKVATITGVRPPSRFGELITRGDEVTEFSEKPQVREGYINGGFFIFTRRVFDYLSGDEDCILERAPLERLAKDGDLKVLFHDAYWQCMDTLRDLDILEQEWQGGSPPWKVWE